MTAPRPSLLRQPLALWGVGIVYVVVWVVGILLGSPEVPAEADAPAVAALFAASATVVPFAILVHGIAGLCLAVLGGAISPASVRGAGAVLGILAALLSFAQLLGELVLAASASSALGFDARQLWSAITVVDGAKMVVLAALIATVALASRDAVILRALSALTVAALVVSGIGYLLLSEAWMVSAYVSLPLLLLWMLAAVQRAARPGSPPAVPAASA